MRVDISVMVGAAWLPSCSGGGGASLCSLQTEAIRYETQALLGRGRSEPGPEGNNCFITRIFYLSKQIFCFYYMHTNPGL